MAKLTRRDFLKYVSLLGVISPVFNIDLIRDNLDKFTLEQLKAAGEIADIKEIPPGPYMVSSNDKYYAIKLKDGNTIYMRQSEIEKHYGTLLNFLQINNDIDRIYPVNPPANWND